MKKLLIIGGSGLLGANWAVQMRGAFDTYLTLNSRQISIKGVTGLKIDWNDKPLSLNMIANVHPDIIINAAGYTNVDDCELYPEQSLYANVFIADCALNWQTTLEQNLFKSPQITYSTDQKPFTLKRTRHNPLICTLNTSLQQNN